MEQDLKGTVVNEAPVGPQSCALPEPAGENKSCFPHALTKRERGPKGPGSVVNDAPVGLQSLPMGFARPH